MASRKPKPPPKDDPEQSKRFEEAARELEADESGKQFERAMESVVPARPDEGKRGKVKPRPPS